MVQASPVPSVVRVARSHQILAFLIPVYAAWALALVVVGPPQLGDGPTHPLGIALAMFPVMVATVAAAAVLATAVVDGPDGLRDLVGRLRRPPSPPVWYLLILVPPAAGSWSC